MTTASVPEIDIYRAAQLTILQHEGRALLIAMRNIAAFSKKQDEAGANTWRRIADAIEWMQMRTDLKGETRH